jgi:hypothetical protein
MKIVILVASIFALIAFAHRARTKAADPGASL